MISNLRRILQAVVFVVLTSSTLHAAPFVVTPDLGTSTSEIKFKIKKPKVTRGYTLSSLRLEGCWLNEGLSSLKATSKKGKKTRALKFKKDADSSSYVLKTLRGVSFPITIVAKLDSAREVVAGGGGVVGVASVSCKKKNKKCVDSLPVEVRDVAPGVLCDSPHDFQENISTAALRLAEGSETTLHSRLSPVGFTLSEGAFATDLSDFSVIANEDAVIGSELQINSNVLSVNQSLIEGLNTLVVLATDSVGRQVSGNFKFWMGSNTLVVKVNDASGNPIDGATVTLSLADDGLVSVSKTTTAGAVTFENVPSTTVAITATTSSGLYGFVATTGSIGTTSLSLVGFQAASSVENNDISKGTEGWTVVGTDSSILSVVTHQEEANASAFARDEPSANQDLRLSTSGEGVQMMTRTFSVSAGASLIKVRFKFTTSEFPADYFGSKFNDFYQVAIRTQSGGKAVADSNSMNALGEGAFSPSGDTDWRTVSLPVDPKGDTVQIQIAVANVADGAYDSQVTVDYIEESNFAITKAELLDIDNSKLEYLSADGPHTYFDGFTYVKGTISFKGEKGDKIDNLELQIMEGTKLLATAKLSTQANKKVLKKFTKTGVIEVKTPVLLFKLFPNDSTALDSSTDRDFTLNIHATTEKGKSADFAAGTVKQLVRFKGSARYDERDPIEGGDDWLRPSARVTADGLSGVTWGDFSNMNGGHFIGHDEHDNGQVADGSIAGYNALDDGAAQGLIDLLNTPQYGVHISSILAAYRRSEGSRFYRKISGVTLKDGRRADRVILPASDHRTHFHLRLR